MLVQGLRQRGADDRCREAELLPDTVLPGF
jgi:hypothetical protein